MFEQFTNFMRTDVIHLMHPPLGLDLSDLSVKLIQIDKSVRGYSVRSYARADILNNGIRNGEIQQPEEVINAIQRTLSKSLPRRPSTRRVVCSIPETKAFLRIIEMPKMEKKEMDEAIRWEIEENIPLSIDQVYYDYQVLEKKFGKDDGKHKNVLIVAVSRSIVDSFIEVVQGAGLEVIGMEVESVAQARCLLPDKQKDDYSSLIVDVGDRRTSLLFSVGNAIAFTSSTSVSSQMMTEAYASHFRVDVKKAEKMKIEQGIGSVISEDAFFRAVEPVLNNLYGQIQHSINFIVNSLQYTENIDDIILCGGGANTKGLSLYLSRKTGIPVKIGDPWKNIEFYKRVPPIPQKDAIQYSTAIGLALQSLYFAYEDLS